MKKTLIFTTLLLLMSCKKETTDPKTTTTTDVISNSVVFHPPSWIIGNWAHSTYASIGQYNVFGFTITNDDVIQNQGASISLKTNINDGKGSVTNEISTSTKFSFTQKVSSISSSYYFVKIDNNTLMFYNQDPSLPNVNGIKMIKY